jgi:hypothetical protein
MAQAKRQGSQTNGNEPAARREYLFILGELIHREPAYEVACA